MNHPSEIRFAPHCHEFHGVNKGTKDAKDLFFYLIGEADQVNYHALAGNLHFIIIYSLFS